jgi:hypothetical protein
MCPSGSKKEVDAVNAPTLSRDEGCYLPMSIPPIPVLASPLFLSAFFSPGWVQQLPPMEQVTLPLSSVVQHFPIFLHESPQQAGTAACVAAGCVMLSSANTGARSAPMAMRQAATRQLKDIFMKRLQKSTHLQGDAAVGSGEKQVHKR